MPNITVDIVANSTGAKRKIDGIIASLQKMAGTVSSLGSVASAIGGIRGEAETASASIATVADSIQKIAESAKSVGAISTALRNIGGSATGIDKIPTSFSEIATSAEQASEPVSRLTQRIAELSGYSGYITDIGNAMRRIGNVLSSEKDPVIFDKIADGARNAIQPVSELADRMQDVKTSFGRDRSISDATSAIRNAGQEAKKSAGFFGKLGASVGRIAMYRLLRTALKKIAEAFKEGLENAYQFSKLTGGPLAKSMDSVKSAGMTMKNQLGAALGGLVQTVAPAIEALIGVLTRLAQVLTQVFSLLGGSGTYLKATSGVIDDIGDSAGGAGGKIKGLLASFDELNVIGQEASGGGGGSSTDVSGMYENAEIESWIKKAFDASGITESWKSLKGHWEELVNAVKNGDFGEAINTFVLDPLRTTIDLLDGIVMLLKGIMTGDLWLVGVSALKIGFDLITNTVIMPLARTIDFIFGTHLSEQVLAGKNVIDNGLADLANLPVWATIREKITGVFTSAWQKAQEAWKKIQRIFLPAAQWFGTLFKSISQIVRAALKVLENGFMYSLNSVKEAFAKVWNNYLREPVTTFLLWLIDVIEPVALWIAGAIDKFVAYFNIGLYTIKTTVLKLWNWLVTTILNPGIDMLNLLGEKSAEFLHETYDEIEHLNTVEIEPFDTMTLQAMGAAQSVKDAFTGMREYLNNELSATPTITYSYNNAPAAATVGSSPSTAGLKGKAVVSLYASGGWPDTGEMFIARESGPELVGTIGNRTAVANNADIIAGIEGGVMRANEEQSALLRQTNALLSAMLNKEYTISPSAALGQVVAKSAALYARS